MSMENEKPWVDGLTIGAALAETVRKFPGREALVFPQAGVRWSYQEFSGQVDAAAKGLLAMGLAKGDHIAVWATNIPEWIVLQYAAARIGVVLVTVNPAYRVAELKYTIGQSDMKALFLTDQFKSSQYYEILAEAVPELAGAQPGKLAAQDFPELKWVVALKNNKPNGGYLNWSEMLEKGKDTTNAAFVAAQQNLSCNDKINIQYTSGTTGFPKAATLTHRNILMNAYYVTGCQKITEADRMCVPVPFYHCFGCVMGSLGAIVRGAALVVPAEYFDPAATLDTCEKEQCTTLYGVPTMFIAQLEHPSFKGRKFSLRSGIMAGSPCPIEVMKRVNVEMGCHEITIAYGQTETSPVLTQSRTDDALDVRVETVGRALPGVELKIVCPETGETLGDNEQGEICARGHCTMTGYYKNDEATACTIHDGWVHTGDLGIRRPDGNFKITGRIKDMIIRGGENVYPREIEEFIFTHPAVEQVSIVGLPDEKYGEEICAWIQLKPGHSANEEEIKAYCKKNLAHYKVPRYVKFVTEYPLTVSGKIQKFKIREAMVKELGLKEQATA